MQRGQRRRRAGEPLARGLEVEAPGGGLPARVVALAGRLQHADHHHGGQREHPEEDEQAAHDV